MPQPCVEQLILRVSGIAQGSFDLVIRDVGKTGTMTWQLVPLAGRGPATLTFTVPKFGGVLSTSTVSLPALNVSNCEAATQCTHAGMLNCHVGYPTPIAPVAAAPSFASDAASIVAHVAFGPGPPHGATHSDVTQAYAPFGAANTQRDIAVRIEAAIKYYPLGGDPCTGTVKLGVPFEFFMSFFAKLC